MGDLNNDGVNEIGLGIPAANNNSGEIIVIYGRINGEFFIFILFYYLFQVFLLKLI